MDNQNFILDVTEGYCLDPSSKLACGQYNNCIKNNVTENIPGLVTEHKKEEAKTKKRKKKKKKKSSKKSKKKKKFN